MEVYFTQEFTEDVLRKFSVITSIANETTLFFENKQYGGDLLIVYISTFCMSPKFEPFFKIRKPKYIEKGEPYIHKGVELHSKDRSLSYELRLNYTTYSQLEDVRTYLAKDILHSLEIIRSIKKIKDFDLTRFRSDFEQFFKLNGWLD